MSLVYIASILAGLVYIPENVLSAECYFDSYMIINGKCVDLTKKSNTNTVHRTIYRNHYQDKPETLSTIPSKTCKDFKYQIMAQSYFDRHSESKRKFDLDNDGYVCENLERTSNVLTKQIWQSLLYENRQRKIETDNKHALTFRKTTDIIGFYPSLNKATRRHVWEDPIGNKRIEIRFFNNEIKDMKGIGF